MLRVYDGAMPAKRPTPTTFDGWLGSVIEGLIGPLDCFVFDGGAS